MTLVRRRIDFFEKPSPNYDAVFDLLTFKQDAGFQKKAVNILTPRKGEKILDLCSGMERVASRILQRVDLILLQEVNGLDYFKGDLDL